MRNGSIPGTRGRVRPLTLFGDTPLHTPCREVTDFGPELATLVEDLFATMYAAQGVGLAANQVGESLRVFVYDCPDDDEVRHLGHLVNPRLVAADGVSFRGPEGCLSLPGLEAGTERYDHAVVEGFTVTGEHAASSTSATTWRVGSTSITSRDGADARFSERRRRLPGAAGTSRSRPEPSRTRSPARRPCPRPRPADPTAGPPGS